MIWSLLAAAVAPRTGNICKNGLSVFEREECVLQNDIFNFAFRYSQSSGIALERIYVTFQKAVE